MISKQNRLIGAILLVSGTTIGAGMLALPISTGLAGFIPSVVLMTAIWLFMLLTAFYLLEVNLRMPGESNIISMVHKTLGRPGEVVAWITYLLLLYTLLAAFLVGCSQLISDFVGSFTSYEFPGWFWPVAIFVVFGSFVYFGTEVVDFLNRFLMTGLVIAYVVLIVMGFFHVNLSFLTHHDWPLLISASSVVVTSFGYHIIIPTLSTYLEHDHRLMRKAIFIGSLIPFLIYLFWQFLSLGVVPIEGEVSLTTAAEQGLQITFFLKQIIASPLVGWAARGFAFFAIITTLIGVSLSLTDFLADGLKMKQTHKNRFFLLLCTFIPPLIFAVFYPQGFILALKYAGIWVVILLALLPALMAWFERYGRKKERDLLKAQYKVPGGKFGVGATIVLSVVLLIIEVVT